VDKHFGGNAMNRWEFAQKQSLPYEAKIQHAIRKANEFYEDERVDGNVFCSVGGLDSITLLLFLRKYVNKNIRGVSISVLEDKSIQAVHHQLGNMIFLKPYKSKVEVIKEFGFPVISKAKAAKIANLQKPDNPKQTFIHAIMTGDMGEQGKFEHSDKIKLPDKWIKLFGGLYNDHRPDLECACAPFKVSADCCLWMKEKPANDYAKQSGRHPYMGLMASEGGQRELGLIKNGCNYFSKTTIRSCPFAPFLRQDLLQLALDLDVPVPKIYGEIVRDPNDELRTTRAQRTGCSMCGFGIHIEPRPHRFDRLRADNPSEWDFWMNRCATDENGEKYGWGRVLDYIGVGWREPIEEVEQMSLEVMP
jgi:3'-phosphoadenosine 5'-phosphosulfate sulfotransferase (PAPS reductase)/FAD synthetase